MLEFPKKEQKDLILSSIKAWEKKKNQTRRKNLYLLGKSGEKCMFYVTSKKKVQPIKCSTKAFFICKFTPQYKSVVVPDPVMLNAETDRKISSISYEFVAHHQWMTYEYSRRGCMQKKGTLATATSV